MTVLVQDKESHKFLGKDGGWHKSPTMSKPFATESQAFDGAKNTEVKCFNIVFYFPLTGYVMKVDEGANIPGLSYKSSSYTSQIRPFWGLLEILTSPIQR